MQNHMNIKMINGRFSAIVDKFWESDKSEKLISVKAIGIKINNEMRDITIHDAFQPVADIFQLIFFLILYM